jgi:hypothetical protein
MKPDLQRFAQAAAHILELMRCRSCRGFQFEDDRFTPRCTCHPHPTNEMERK